jgi:trimethylamine--corrinoid protein Co-methyltransferase
MTDRPSGGPRYARLSDDACARIHAASLAILERTGARLEDAASVDLLRAAGARVDEGDRVRIPASLVEWALSTVPKEVTLFDRRGRPAIRLAGSVAFFGPGSDCLNVIDHRTGERRKPVLRDVEEGIALCDSLPNIDFVMSMFLPTDVDQRRADRHQMAVMLTRTTKPIVLVTYETSGLADALEMAEASAGGREALRERPFLACYINVTRGLLQNGDALEKLRLLAERGLPALWIPVTSGGTTGPVTVAGNLALNNAGVLVGIVLSQLVRAGAPLIVPGFGGDALDLRTTVDPYAGPDHRGCVPALAHWYGLPMFSLAGGADAKVPDQQAAAEAALTLYGDAVSGGHLIHDSGYLESGLTGSLVQLAICDEIIAWIRRAIAPVEVSDETLALDLVDEVGIEGSYLETDHTLAHYRERWYPDLFERYTNDGWRSRGGLTLAERAARRVDELLAAHTPPSVDPAVARAIRAVVERAEEVAGL